jgi:hypothetical protein
MKSRKIRNLLNIKTRRKKVKNNSTRREKFNNNNNNNKTLKNKQEKYIKNNNVIIVGNAPTNLDNEFGKLINNYDIILRFNEFVIKDYEKNIGTKTSIWVINDWVAMDLLNKYKNWLEKNKHVEILIVIPYIKNDPENFYQTRYDLINNFYNQSNIKNKLDFINKDFVKKIQEKYEFNNTWASTGLITILYFIEYYKDINITGFNFFKKVKESDSIHYYNSNDISNHNGDKEKNIVNDLIKNKRIKKLTLQENNIIFC